MSEPTEPQHGVASVLVIAADPNIESLVGELVAFAGHRPVYDPTAGAAGESVRRVRPAVTLLDTALDPEVVRACLRAADEVGSRPVLMSSTASDSELVEEARAQGCLFFPLPGGPKPLGRVLERAIADRSERVVDLLPRSQRTTRPKGSVHPALCAALASVARARAVFLRAENGEDGAVNNYEARHTTQDALEGTKRSRSALRAAVTDYTRQLKTANIPEDETLTIVRDAIQDCSSIVGADATMGVVLEESETWTRQVYRAAGRIVG